MLEPIISVENICRSFELPRHGHKKAWFNIFEKAAFDTFPAVSDLSFVIQSGSKVAFIGPNGAGKSTTLKMLCGLLRPNSGNIRVCGLVPWEDTRALSRKVGLVFGQRSHLWAALPVKDSFDLLAKIYDLNPVAYATQRDKLTEVFGIGALLKQSARTLSLGQRRGTTTTSS